MNDMPFYEKGDVRIRYEEAGSGFPLLVTPGGGLNSRVSNWPTAVFNAMDIFSDEFRCITMDQRNANGGESSGPIPVDDPWGAFADDQLGLMHRSGRDVWAPELLARRPDLNMTTIENYLHNLYRIQPDFVYSVSRDLRAPARHPC